MDKILTVVIPTYNMESYLEKCLDSVLVEQVIGLIEVMIVNDGSKDSSLLIAKRYQNRYSLSGKSTGGRCPTKKHTADQIIQSPDKKHKRATASRGSPFI